MNLLEIVLLMQMWPNPGPGTRPVSALDVDFYLDFEDGSNGDAISTTNLGNATRGGNGTWSIVNSATGMTISTSGERALLGNVKTIGDSLVYGDASGTRGFQFDTAYTVRSAQYEFTAAPNVSCGYWFRMDIASVTEAVTLGGIFGQSGSFAPFHLGVGPAICLSTSGDPCVSIANQTWYWISTLYDDGGTHRTYVFDANGLFIGAASMTAQGSDDAYRLNIGRSGAETTTPTGNYRIDDVVMDYTDATFPLIPMNPKHAAPTYDYDTGTYTNSVTVTISNAARLASSPTIKYCTDTAGTCTPTTTYSSPITITTTGTHLRSLVSQSGWTDSSIKDATYTINTSSNPSYSTSAGTRDWGTAVGTTLTVTSGRLLVVSIFWASGSITLDSVTASSCVSGGFTLLHNPTTSGSDRAALAYGVTTSGGSCTVTANVSSAASVGITVTEVQDGDFDTSALRSQTGGSPVTSGNITPAANGALLVGTIMLQSTSTATFGSSSPFTERLNSSANAYSTQTYSQTTAAAISSSFTVSPTWPAYFVGIVSVKPK